jgi:hypothetical protein
VKQVVLDDRGYTSRAGIFARVHRRCTLGSSAQPRPCCIPILPRRTRSEQLSENLGTLSEPLLLYSPKCVEEEFSEVRGSNLPRPDRGLGDRDGATGEFLPTIVDTLAAFVARNCY